MRLSNIKYSTVAAPTLSYIDADTGVLAGAAKVQTCTACSDGKDVGYVGNNAGSLTLSNIQASAKETVLYFDYVNADVGFSFVGATNDRVAQISVNGGSAQNVSFPCPGTIGTKTSPKGTKSGSLGSGRVPTTRSGSSTASRVHTRPTLTVSGTRLRSLTLREAVMRTRTESKGWPSIQMRTWTPLGKTME